MSELIINVAVSHLSLLTARTLYTQTDHINRTVIKGCSNGPTRGRACSPQEPLVGVPHGPLRLSTHGCLRLVNYGYPQRARLSRSRVAPGHKNASHIHSHGRNELQASNWKKKADAQLRRQSQQRSFNAPGRHSTCAGNVLRTAAYWYWNHYLSN